MKEPKGLKEKATYDYQVGALAYLAPSRAAHLYGHKYHMWCSKCGQYLGWFSCGHRWDWAAAMARSGNQQHMDSKDCNPNPPLYKALRGLLKGYLNARRKLCGRYTFATRYGADVNLLAWRNLAATAKIKYYSEV